MKELKASVQSLFVVLVIGFSSSLAWAESYFLKPATNASIPADQLAAINDLLRISVGGMSGVELVAAQKEGVTVLEPRVVKLGNAYILSLSKIKNGQTVFQQQARASSLEDMDTVASRVARATVTETSFQSDTRVSDVTEDQVTRGTRRKDTVNQWFFGFGPGSTSNLATGNSGTYFTLGYSWGLDEHFSLNLGWEVLNVKDSNATLGHISIGTDYHFMDRNTSPYLSAAVGYGNARGHTGSTFLSANTDSASGWTLAVGGGMKFFRASRVNLGVSARYILLTADTAAGTPSATVGALTLYF